MRFTVLVALACALVQNDGKDAARTKEIERWEKYLGSMAKSHRITPADDPSTPFRLVERPVFRWDNPDRLGQVGFVYLWVREDDRPAAVGTLICWRYWQQYWAIIHEFHSLSESPLKLVFRDYELWKPAAPGLRWRPVETETPVAASRDEQQSQIRRLARQFRAKTVDSDGVRHELQLASRPLYEYAAEEGSAQRAGAVFAFCQDSDPELILLIEARPARDGAAWHYACGSFTDRHVDLRYGGREVWAAPATPDVTKLSPDKPYWREYITVRALVPEDDEP